MQNQARTNQGGSVISFLIVGIVLAAIVLGGIYFVGQRSKNQQPNPSPQPVASNPTTSPSANGNPSSPQVPSTKPSPTPSSTPQPTTPPVAGSIPSTGPTEDLIMASIPGAILLGTVVAYIRSYKTRFGSLRR